MAFNEDVFLSALSPGLLGAKVDPKEKAGCKAVTGAMTGTPLAYCAYALATAWHETAATMMPVREAFWLSETWRKKNLRYYPWYGRGYVQLTWEENYERADEALQLNGTLIQDLDRAMEPDLAARIMRRGMLEGWFAGNAGGRHTLARHLPEDRAASQAEFVAARRIINGTDKALPIARYALEFQSALKKAGW